MKQDSFVLLCKSFGQDVRRVDRLLASVQRFNRDDIPVVLCVPQADESLFKQTLKHHRFDLITDEAVVEAHPLTGSQQLMQRYRSTPGALSQQVVKSEAWRLIGCDAYLCLDSDTVFIRPFGLQDFVATDGHPYTVLHQDRELFQLARCHGHAEVWKSFHATAQDAQHRFDRAGPTYSYGPFPVLWSTRVWMDLEQRYLVPRGLTLWDAIDALPSEAHWYGEALLAFQSIPLRVIGPLCRCYHYDWQWKLLRRLGESEASLAHDFMCVIYQSNWDEAMDHGQRRSRLSQLARTIKRLWR